MLLDDDHDVWVDGCAPTSRRCSCALAHHRQRGADLVYEAYDVDIGGGC